MSELQAQSFRIRGVVQGVGFRPFVFRLACAYDLSGWVANDPDGVTIHVEGTVESLAAFGRDLVDKAPAAAGIDGVDVAISDLRGFERFVIAESERGAMPTAGISPDLPVCEACIAEAMGSGRRSGYAYVNCSACGPRFSIIEALPYDRASTTMCEWSMCNACYAEFEDPSDRRFHAQPIACPNCGPAYRLIGDSGEPVTGTHAIRDAAKLLATGRIIAIKGIGGYHLACDAGNAAAVSLLRERKFRKEQPFALMVRDTGTAERTIDLSTASRELLASSARPIVIGKALIDLALVAPDTAELGVMLPYTPLHYLLFEEGAPERLVMTSGNSSSDPIAFRNEDALERLSGMADAFLVGERKIARRIDDSVARIGPGGLSILRRARGYAPRSAARLDLGAPTLAVGADLKNAITLVVNGEAIVSQHIGDLSYNSAAEAFRETIDDLISMHRVDIMKLQIVHDLHPRYFSTAHALDLECARHFAVQHHRAHIASVVAERGAFDERIVGVAFDGTGFGDDGSIWGGEFFVGSVVQGLNRVGHLRSFRIPGGDAAARFPVQAAAGLLSEAGIPASAVISRAPFDFPDRYSQALTLLETNVRCFDSTSAGRLFDTVAALLGFTRKTTYEGQAAMWLENLASCGNSGDALEFPFAEGILDFCPALSTIIEMRERRQPTSDIARSFHRGLARGIANAIEVIAETESVRTAVLSGGVFQNQLLLSDVFASFENSRIRVWTNNVVPCNDGGISLGQAALTMGFRQ